MPRQQTNTTTVTTPPAPDLVEYVDENTGRKFILPVTWEQWDKYTPGVQDAVLKYYVNTTIQGERLYGKGGKPPVPPKLDVPMTPGLRANPLSNAMQPQINPDPLAATRTVGNELFTPFLQNMEGLAGAVFNPARTIGEFGDNAVKFAKESAERAEDPQIGPIEREGRKMAGGLGGVLGTAGLQQASENLDVTKPESMARFIGEMGSMLLPTGALRGARKADQVVNTATDLARRGTGPTFKRTIGDPRYPAMQTSIPRTMIEMMEEKSGGPTTLGNVLQQSIDESTALSRFNADRVEALTARLRQLPVQLGVRGTLPAAGVQAVRGATKIENVRVPAGQVIKSITGKNVKGGAIAKVAKPAISQPTYKLLGLSLKDAAADLKNLPYDDIQAILRDVHQGSFPSPLFKHYVVQMIDDVIEEAMPHSNLNVSSVDRRAAGIINTRGPELVEALDRLSTDSYKTAAGSTVPWNRLKDIAHAAGTDVDVLRNNVAAIATQLKHLQENKKLGLKTERLNLSATVPVSSAAKLGRVSGPVSSGLGAMGGGAIGFGMGGVPGAVVGASAGVVTGSMLPKIISYAVTSPRLMFALQQFLRMSSTAAAEFAQAQRVVKIMEEEQRKELDEADKQAQNDLRRARGEVYGQR